MARTDPSPLPQPSDATELVERLRRRPGEDHKRGCPGREYACSCRFNAENDELFEQAAEAITQAQARATAAEGERDRALLEIESAHEAFDDETDVPRHDGDGADYDIRTRMAVLQQHWRNRVGLDALTPQQRADIDAHIRGLTEGPATYPQPRHGWTCFHCGETFRTEQGARLHFGEGQSSSPECVAQPTLDEIVRLFNEHAQASYSSHRGWTWVGIEKAADAILALRKPSSAQGEVVKYAALGRACEANGLGWYIEDGSMRFQPPAELIAEQASEAAQQTITQLTRERDEARFDATRCRIQRNIETARADRAEALLETARKVLEPFAERAGPDRGSASKNDYRAAASFLSSLSHQDEQG